MAAMPALFISHGSPMLAIDGQPAHHFLKRLASELPRPTAILIVSAHWETDIVAVNTTERPRTVYDFGGFDPRLNQIVYSAPGAPELARRAATLIAGSGLEVVEAPGQGWDHGVWVPLHLVYPAADIPIAQVSMQPQLGPAHHLALGRALRPLRDEGVLIIGSGAMTHNLRAFFNRNGAAGDDGRWVEAFTDWMRDRLERAAVADLVAYRTNAPYAVRNHPTDEHLLPLYVPLGATQPGEPIRRIHASVDGGVVAMDAYRFGA